MNAERNGDRQATCVTILRHLRILFGMCEL